ncbi:MAG TPA: CpsD/CapB family tyrosine-protein kinase [Gaiellaceae bacterium]|nr:CpsD/CapB family tyrosine-protein kinase [Gaiellaceae bacterium]
MNRAPIRSDSLEAESYRSLRTTLTYSHLPEGRRVVLFTSARRNEGKSTTAANFAAICAYGERQTLLIDADLRNPRVESLFGLPDVYGLSALLAAGGNADLADIVVRTRIPTLDLLPAGDPAGNAAELLSRPKLAHLVEEARAGYDWVVVDAPPVLPIADAAILSRLVDGVVLVVDVSRTPIEAVRRAKDLLRAVDARLLGIVANRSPVKATAYGYGR